MAIPLEKALEKTSLKRVLVLGQTGGGKSTAVNTLFNESAHPQELKSPAPTGQSMGSVTSCFTTYFNLRRSISYTDSIGFGDHRFSNDEIVRALRSVTKVCQAPFHALILVVRYGRLSSETRANIEFVQHLFGDSWQSHAVLVQTHSPEAMTSEKWIEMNKESENNKDKTWVSINKIKHVVFVDNCLPRDPEEERYYLATRQQGLINMINSLKQCNGSIRPTKTFWEWIKGLVSFLSRGQSDAKLLTKIQRELTNPDDPNMLAWKSNYGPCPVCLEDMEASTFEHLGTSTCCKTVFHDHCLREVLARRNICPMCKQSMANKLDSN